MLEDWRQEEIKGEIQETEFLKQKFEVARGLNAKLSRDIESGKWFYLAGDLCGVGDSASDALNSLWDNFNSKEYSKIPF
jgi:hypothetical protein